MRPTRLIQTQPRSRWPRRIGAAAALLLATLLGTSLYSAYAYQPAEDGSTPAYLAKVRADHLDGYVAAGAFRVHYVHEGSGSPVVILPGGNTWVFGTKNLMEALAAHHSVYALDAPGTGWTAPLAAQPDYGAIYSFDGIDQSLLAFFDRMGIASAPLIGASWGGGFATYFAERHPDRVSRLVELGGEGPNLDDSGDMQIFSALKLPVVGELSDNFLITPDFVRQQFQYTVFDQALISAEFAQQLYVPLTFRYNRIADHILNRNLQWSRTEALMPNLRMPVQVIWGREDRLMYERSFVPRWKQLVPQAQVTVLDRAGHAVEWDQPAEVHRLVEAFVS